MIFSEKLSFDIFDLNNISRLQNHEKIPSMQIVMVIISHATSVMSVISSFQTMRGSRKFCQTGRGPTLTFFFCYFS